LAAGACSQASAGTTALVPAYFYPGGSTLGYWNQLDQAANNINVDVIVNPASGPGTMTDPNSGANPYDHLPSYWDQEVAAISSSSSLPEPSALAMLASGGLLVSLACAVRKCGRSHGRA